MRIPVPVIAAMTAAAASVGWQPIQAQRRPPWTLPAPDYGGATPLNERDWFSFTDYPLGAAEQRQQGYVVIRYTITVAGRVADCAVIRSSGFARLDAVPCRLFERRARFTPAQDETGSPRATRATSAMQFWLPGEN
jgi:protein TonB